MRILRWAQYLVTRHGPQAGRRLCCHGSRCPQRDGNGGKLHCRIEIRNPGAAMTATPATHEPAQQRDEVGNAENMATFTARRAGAEERAVDGKPHGDDAKEAADERRGNDRQNSICPFKHALLRCLFSLVHPVWNASRFGVLADSVIGCIRSSLCCDLSSFQAFETGPRRDSNSLPFVMVE